VEPLYGVRHFQSESVFEALMTVIIEQQISLRAALRAQRALAEWGGGRIQHGGNTYYTFPTPQQVASATHDDLHAILKITHRRVDVMQQIARGVVSGQLDLEGMRGQPVITVYEQLTAIKWVGHWTAAWTLIRGLNNYDYVGHNDVALRSAAAWYFYDTDDRVSADEVTDTFAAYAPYSGIAAFYTLMCWAVDRY
jgi:DNA-3-methyladenine glycosylase II